MNNSIVIFKDYCFRKNLSLSHSSHGHNLKTSKDRHIPIRHKLKTALNKFDQYVKKSPIFTYLYLYLGML